MRLDICGPRGSTPAPGADFVRYGGHTSCVVLSADGDERPTLILDAGTGIRAAAELFDDQPLTGTILLSHLHWDHIQGLPFFAGDREDTRVGVLMPEQPGEPDAVAVLAGAMSPPYFPVDPTQLPGEWTFAEIGPGAQRLGAFSVIAREIPHGGGRTFGYRIGDGRATLAYMPDHRPTALGFGPDGLGAYHPAALELAEGVDMLVHDAQLTRAELAAQEQFGHACIDYALALGVRARVRAVLLFHHAPDRTDNALDGLAERLPDAPPSSFAVQGQVLRL